MSQAILLSSKSIKAKIYVKYRTDCVVKNNLQVSYDHLNWHPISAEWLFKEGYTYDEDRKMPVPLPDDDDPMCDMNGNPITQSCQAKEAKPKLLEPMWDEREV